MTDSDTTDQKPDTPARRHRWGWGLLWLALLAPAAYYSWDWYQQRLSSDKATPQFKRQAEEPPAASPAQASLPALTKESVLGALLRTPVPAPVPVAPELPPEPAARPAPPPLPTAPPTFPPRISDLEERIDKLERMQENQQTILAALKETRQAIRALENRLDEIEQAAPQARPDMTAPLIHFYRFEKKALSGEPFREALGYLLSDDTLPPSVHVALNTLREDSRKGVASEDTLRAEFTEALELYVHPSASGDVKGGFFSETTKNLKSLVIIRKVGEHEGSDDGSIVARAEQRVGEGDFAAAAQELRQLSDESIGYFEEWLEMYDRRQSLEGELERIRSLLFQQAEPDAAPSRSHWPEGIL